MRATGDARIPGLIMTGGAVLNLALDPMLIFGWFGAPRLELTGAAVAMVLSRFAMTALLLLLRGRTETSCSCRFDNGATTLLASWREILAIGLPAMATQMIGPISGAIITRLLASHGHDVVAGFGVAGRIEGVAVMLLFALSGSIGPFVGQNWGAGDLDRVHGGIRVAYRFSLAWGAAAWLVLMLIGDWVVPLIDDNAEVVAVARHYLAIVPISYGLWGVLMMASASFNSLGKPIPSTIMAFTRMFVVYVPLAMLADHLFGYTGIFVATAAANCVMGLLGIRLAEAFICPHRPVAASFRPDSALFRYGRRLVTVPSYLALTVLVDSCCCRCSRPSAGSFPCGRARAVRCAAAHSCWCICGANRSASRRAAGCGCATVCRRAAAARWQRFLDAQLRAAMLVGERAEDCRRAAVLAAASRSKAPTRSTARRRSCCRATRASPTRSFRWCSTRFRIRFACATC